LRTNWAPCQPGLPPQSKYRGAAKRAAACASAWILVASAAEQMPPPPPPPPPLLPTVSRSAAAAVLGTGVLTGSGGLGCQASVVVCPTVAWCQRPSLRGRCSFAASELLLLLPVLLLVLGSGWRSSSSLWVAVRSAAREVRPGQRAELLPERQHASQTPQSEQARRPAVADIEEFLPFRQAAQEKADPLGRSLGGGMVQYRWPVKKNGAHLRGFRCFCLDVEVNTRPERFRGKSEG